MICWSCERDAGGGVMCVRCGALQPPDTSASHFAVLGIEARFDLDMTLAEGRYKELTRMVHPDRFARADGPTRRASLARAVQLNDAWRTLRDPVQRAEYLLKLQGMDVADERVTAKAPPALLMEVMELREALAEARLAGDHAAALRLAALVRARRERGLAEVAAALAVQNFSAAAAALIALRFHARFLEEVTVFEEAGEGTHA